MLPHRTPAWLLGAVLLLGLVPWLGGCVVGPSLAPSAGGAGAAEPWRIPPAAYGSQRLFRVSFAGPQGEGSLKLTLRLASAERYQVTTADALGRALWSLDVDRDAGLWLDHRNRGFCHFNGRFDVSGIPLAPFPILSLPALLLGRVPAEPAEAPPLPGSGSGSGSGKDAELSYLDEMDRRWTATVAGRGGAVTAWTLWDDAGKPAVLWVRKNDWAILSDRAQGVQMRWQEVVRETLAGPPAVLKVPAGFTAADCGGE